MKIIHAASEFAPWMRVGRLADAVGGLARELARMGHQVGVFLPGYRQVLADPRAAGAKSLFKHTLDMGDSQVTAETLRLPLEENLTLYLVRRDESFDRTHAYGPPGGEYEDSQSRFLIFSKAVVDALCRFDAPMDVLHCHDWPTALAPLLLRVEERKRNISAVARTVLTIHNPAFQGVYPGRTFSRTNLPDEFFAPDGLEFFGQVNTLKGGIFFSDYLLAPSPSAAQEMLQPEGGFGIEGALSRRKEDFRGMLTGLDKDDWNPAADPWLIAAFHAGLPDGKSRCRDSLRKGLGLDLSIASGAIVMAEIPLMETLGLGDPRVLLSALRDDTTLVLLGPASPGSLGPWRSLAGARPGRIVLLEDPLPGVIHRVLGGVDFCLGAARIEPSPHNAQRAMRYGAIPIMPCVGGPEDVIVDFTEQPAKGTGVLFAPNAGGWSDGLARALALHERPAERDAVRMRAMSTDSTWARFGPPYAKLYNELV